MLFLTCMSDYEEYWWNRNKIENVDSDEDMDRMVEKVHFKKEEIIIHDSYKLNGEMVYIHIDSGTATFNYANGTQRSVPAIDLLFCPECVKEKIYPFSDDGNICELHKIQRIQFDLEKYESFKLISGMEGGTSEPNK